MLHTAHQGREVPRRSGATMSCKGTESFFAPPAHVLHPRAANSKKRTIPSSRQHTTLKSSRRVQFRTDLTASRKNTKEWFAL